MDSYQFYLALIIFFYADIFEIKRKTLGNGGPTETGGLWGGDTSMA